MVVCLCQGFYGLLGVEELHADQLALLFVILDQLLEFLQFC